VNQKETRDNILEILHRIAPEADLDGLDVNENIREALDIDSFDFLNVVIALHERFGVNIPESDYSQVATLKGMMEYLDRGRRG
jgi:acyl carrier protein